MEEKKNDLLLTTTTKLEKIEDDDDDCVILEGNPFAPTLIDDLTTEDGGDDVIVVRQTGEVACRDYPHPRHLCATFPFASTSHYQHCGQCHCYVCDSLAPCTYWGTGTSNTDHCHATDKDQTWKLKRNFVRLYGGNAVNSIPQSGIYCSLQTFQTQSSDNHFPNQEWLDYNCPYSSQNYINPQYIQPHNSNQDLGYINPHLNTSCSINGSQGGINSQYINGSQANYGNQYQSYTKPHLSKKVDYGNGSQGGVNFQCSNEYQGYTNPLYGLPYQSYGFQGDQNFQPTSHSYAYYYGYNSYGNPACNLLNGSEGYMKST